MSIFLNLSTPRLWTSTPPSLFSYARKVEVSFEDMRVATLYNI